MYCVLWGTLLLDYENEEEAKSSLSPKVVVEILGVSEWDGKGRANNYPGGFLLVTHTGGTYYVSVASTEERDEWILQVKRSLECVFANPEVAPFKPSKIIQNRPPQANNHHCPISREPLNGYGTLCRSCGRTYSSSDFVQESLTLLQLGSEESERVCLDCKNAQMCILWLKALNYVHTMDLHELTPRVLQNFQQFKATFKVRRRFSQRLDMAADLFDGGNITAEEFEELRSVDYAYCREVRHDECKRLKEALETFGDDMQTILNILLDSNMTDKGGIGAFFQIVVRIFEIADQSPDLVDFFFPQFFQVHLLHASDRTPEALRKVDILQQALLVLAQKYPGFALKLAWNLLAVIGDYQEKKASQVQFAACCCLLMQLEMVSTGLISAIADKPTCEILSHIMRPAMHQQQELGFEIGALFLVRRKLQEAHDEDEKQRQERNRLLYSEEKADEPQRRRSASAIALSQSLGKALPPVFPGSNKECSCLELLYQLGVGQECSYREDEETASMHEPKDDRAVLHVWEGFCDQLDFINRINTLVESLRFEDRPMRTEILRKELLKMNNRRAGLKVASHRGSGRQDSEEHHHSTVTDDLLLRNPMLGWDPIRIAGEPHYRITKFITEECRVFRTKARAPSYIVCEVMRDDIFCKLYHSSVSEALAARQEATVSSPPITQRKMSEDIVNGEMSSHDKSPENKARTVLHSMTSKSRARADSVNHGVSNGVADVVMQQSMQDVDSLVDAIRHPPTIPDHQVTPLSGSAIPDHNHSVPSWTDIVKSNGPNRSHSVGRYNHGLSKATSLVQVPRSSSRSMLPTNRFAASTEGILRSAGESNRSRRPSAGGSSSSKQPAQNGSGKNSPTISGKIPRSASSPSLANPMEGAGESSEAVNDECDDTSVSCRSATISIDECYPGLRLGKTKKEVVQSARNLLERGIIDRKEFEKLMLSDQQYREVVAREEDQLTKNRIEVTLGESFWSKKERILSEKMEFLKAYLPDSVALDMYYSSMSDQEYWPPYDLRAFIVKTNDDLRQEICCMQLMQICKEIFDHFGLGPMLFLKPYRIVCTGSNTGVVEVLTDSISLDALKKAPGFTTLSNYFQKTYKSISEERLQIAKYNFVSSLAAYSLFSYLLQIKDRHNGNLLIDSEGHIIHIDFGFILSIAPGGSFSLETAPFKLTEEMVELLGGLDSPLFGDFVTAFTKGFIALQANCENILSAITLLAKQSTFPCFQNKPINNILEKLRSRFRSELNVKDAVKHCLDLITNSYNHYGTLQYDRYQYLTNGIWA